MTIPADPHTLAVAPDGSPVLTTTARGCCARPPRALPGPRSTARRRCSWSPFPSDTAVGVDPAGALWTSTTADGGLRIVGVTADAVLESRDGGRTSTDVPAA